jgi:hypothetical protein
VLRTAWCGPQPQLEFFSYKEAELNLTKSSQMTDAGSLPHVNILQSVPGMAHFAGTGPADSYCATCIYWQVQGKRTSPSCEKFRSLTNGKNTPLIPAGTPACRHYEAQQ